MAENKVVFGLKKVHYAVITEEGNKIIYGTPVALPGAKSISLEPKGDSSEFYADDIIYYASNSNQGYETTLEIANIPESFRTDVLGETKDTKDKVITENANAKPKKIAFMFEFDGDQKATRHLLTYCTVSRPGLSSESKTETTEPGTTELTLVASPRPTDGVVKISTSSETTSDVYDAWYTKVYEPKPGE